MLIDKFILDIIDCIKKGDTDVEKFKAIQRYFERKDITIKGNYFHIKINEMTKTRGRPRKNIKIHEETTTDTVKTPKIINVSRESDVYVDNLGRSY